MNRPRPGESAPVLVPEGGRFDGRIVVRGAACVAGHVEGPVEGPGRLRVLESAVVSGAIEVDELECAGTIEGPVRVRGVAHLAKGATVRGTLVAPRLSVENGALIQGRCRVGNSQTESNPGV
ncbi:polymer-forming cytoskeletal protein [Myxococcota bacterium]|nr:polymer-forming cytoskeletal protein [Myxococcota bacterium]